MATSRDRIQFPFENPNQYIWRYEKENRRQWRLKFARLGNVVEESFADDICGGTEEALIAARTFRDQWFANFDETDQTLWRREAKRPKKIPSLTGTARYVRKNSPFWKAYWTLPDGSRKTKTFLVKKYGEEGAQKRAEEARIAGMKDVADALKNSMQQPIQTKTPHLP